MDKQIKNRPSAGSGVLILALARHDGPYSSTAWSLAKAFSRENPVVYVDNPFTLTDVFSSKKKDQIEKRYFFGIFRRVKWLQPDPSSSLLVLVPPVMLPVNWLNDGWLYRSLLKFNDRLLRNAIQEVLEKLKWDSYLYINSFNPFYGREANFKPAPSYYVYQTVDEISHSNYIAKHGPALEQEAMKEAAAVVATSRQLQKKAAVTAKEAVYIPNAADIGLFRKAAEETLVRPVELKNEQRKVICYTGHIDKRLDYDLLVAAARHHEDKLFLMVGPLSGTEAESSGFTGLPNVKFTGKKNLEELPAYLQYSHAAIIPFKCNALTAGIYPLKINEYLAAGKGVVSTPFSEDIKDFEGIISLEGSPERFAAAIDHIIKEDKPEIQQQRLKKALSNSWEARVASFWDVLPNSVFEKGENRENLYEEAVK